MLTKRKQYQYLKKRWDEMLTYLILFRDSKDPEDLHKMRVEIKKIYAILKWSPKSLKSKTVKALKKLFKDAGIVRDAYIRLKILNRYLLGNSEFKKEQKALLAKETEKFCLKTNTYIKNINKMFKIIPNHLCGIKNEYILQKYQKQFKKLTRMLSGNGSQKNIHTSRKKIKDMLYNYSLLHGTLIKKLQLNTFYLDKLQTAIGKWHDSVTTTKLLSSEEFINNKVTGKLKVLNGKLLSAVTVLSCNFTQKAVKPNAA